MQTNTYSSSKHDMRTFAFCIIQTNCIVFVWFHIAKFICFISRLVIESDRFLCSQKSFVTKSIKHKRDIVPVFIDGFNSRKFYNIAFWRKKIGISANVEMLFLADEMFKQKGNTINFTFGKSISWNFFNKAFTNLEWAQKVKKHVYALKTNKNIKTIKNQ